MQSEKLDQLKVLIRQESTKLLCETHQAACQMRDENYPQFEELIMDFMFQDEEPVSFQTAAAELEMALTHN